MNCFSTFSGASMRATSNPNSLSAINKSAKNITRDLSGLNIIDLSATSSYHISAAGLNTTNANTSQALLKFGNRALAVSDFSSTGSYTIVLKHAASQSSLPPFNFFYPNVVKLSSVYTAINQDFSAQFYSSLSPGTVIPYSITGIASSGLNNAALNGIFTAPYQVISYRVTTAPTTASVFFNVSGGLSTAYYTYDPTANIFLLYQRYNLIGPTANTSYYGRRVAMSGDGKVYAFTSGGYLNNKYEIFSALTNQRLGSTITDATVYNDQDSNSFIRLNYDGTIFYATDTKASTDARNGEFVAYKYTNNAWTVKGRISGASTIPPRKAGTGLSYTSLGSYFAASDDGLIVHIAYYWNNSGDTPRIETYMYNDVSYSYRNYLEYTTSGLTYFAREFSGTTDGVRLAIGVKNAANDGRLVVYDYNSTANTYTQIGDTPIVSTATVNSIIRTKISSDGSTVCAQNVDVPSVYKIYQLSGATWTLKFTNSLTNINTLPKVNRDGSMFAVTSSGTTTNVSNKVYYYFKNDTSYNLIRTIDMSANIVDVRSTAFSDDLGTFVFGREDSLTNKGRVDVYSYVY